MWGWILHVLQDILRKVVKVLKEPSFFANTWKVFQGFTKENHLGWKSTYDPWVKPLLPVLLFSFLLFPEKQQHTSIIFVSGSCKSNENVPTGSQWFRNQLQNHSPLNLHLHNMACHNATELRRESPQQLHFAHGATASRFFWTKTRGQVWGKGESLQVCPANEPDTPFRWKLM